MGGFTKTELRNCERLAWAGLATAVVLWLPAAVLRGTMRGIPEYLVVMVGTSAVALLASAIFRVLAAARETVGRLEEPDSQARVFKFLAAYDALLIVALIWLFVEQQIVPQIALCRASENAPGLVFAFAGIGLVPWAIYLAVRSVAGGRP